MADLIERLRGPCPGIPAMRDAADEIERLYKWQREMVEKMAGGGRLDGYRELADKLAEQAAEIEQLRAALRGWDALIRFQYTGSQEAMEAMHRCAQRTNDVMKEQKGAT